MELKARSGGVLLITGNRTAVADGCDGIVDYDEEKVILRSGRLTIRLLGRGLRIRRLTEDSAVIEGTIDRVEYTY